MSVRAYLVCLALAAASLQRKYKRTILNLSTLPLCSAQHTAQAHLVRLPLATSLHFRYKRIKPNCTALLCPCAALSTRLKRTWDASALCFPLNCASEKQGDVCNAASGHWHQKPARPLEGELSRLAGRVSGVCFLQHPPRPGSA
eukprot:scaffold99943_cov19-Tisochrysis_lutea.AAC.2